MNQVIQNMKARRSIRSFKSDMLPKEQVEEIIEAGLYAASGKGKQATKIIAVTNKERLQKLTKTNCAIGGWKEGFDPFYGAPLVLIVLGDKDWPTSLYDGSLVMGNLMNAAESLGIGSIWIHRAKEEFEMDEYKAFLRELGIEGNWEGIAHCALGYPAGEVPKATDRNQDRVYWVE